MQLIQLRLSFQKRKLWTMSAQVTMGLEIYLGPDSQEITSKFFVASFLCVLDAVSKK